MKRIFVGFILLFLMSQNLWSQESVRKNLNGKVIVDYNLEDIDVINMQTEQLKRTLVGGYFSIDAQEGDTILFSGTSIKDLKVLICNEDFEKDLLLVNLETKAHQLNEVRVFNYNHINAVSLGIVSKDQKKYTPAERKLKAGTKGFLAIDPVLNFFSGKTADLKRDVETEKKEFWLTKIEELFQDVVLMEKIKIPTEYIKGFQYFLVENKRFIDLLERKNNILRDFVLNELAIKYKKMIANEP